MVFETSVIGNNTFHLLKLLRPGQGKYHMKPYKKKCPFLFVFTDQRNQTESKEHSKQICIKLNTVHPVNYHSEGDASAPKSVKMILVPRGTAIRLPTV